MEFFFFTKYDMSGPSSRYRTYQYLQHYENEGIVCKVFPLFEKEYFELKGSRKVVYVLKQYFTRFFHLLSLLNGKKVYIEYELFPYFFSFFEFILYLFNVKYIVDYDDAIFHNYDNNKSGIIRFLLKKKIKNVIKFSSVVITGSPYLTSYAKKHSKNVIEIPTSVSSEKYNKIVANFNEVFIIGWIGSKSTSVNIVEMIEVFKNISDINYCLYLVGFDADLEFKLKGVNYKIISWTSEFEVSWINKFDVGIMPLVDNSFNKGKCGFKLIQYMACAKPTISTPLEANVKINRNKKNLHASSISEWEIEIRKVFESREVFKRVGMDNYNCFLDFYCVENNKNEYISILKKL
ncbi:glycosyltransferase [Flavobacterium sp.]|uniref:glycosyltransferase n=1 Tax=Flavobacterium sp. TaxID=239 RepID=UPI003D12C066